MKTKSPSIYGLFVLLLLIPLLSSCQPPSQTQRSSTPATGLLEPQVLETWPKKAKRVGLVFTEPVSLREIAARMPGSVEGVLFSIGTLQGAFRSHEPVSAEEASARVRDYARFYLTRQKEFDLQQIHRLLNQYEVRRYSEREARTLFKQSQEAQAYARTLIERSLNRRYARAVLEEDAPVVYALEVVAEPQALWRAWGGSLEGVAPYNPQRRFNPGKPAAVVRSIDALRIQVDIRDLDRLFDEAVRILRQEYGIRELFAGEVAP